MSFLYSFSHDSMETKTIFFAIWYKKKLYGKKISRDFMEMKTGFGGIIRRYNCCQQSFFCNCFSSLLEGQSEPSIICPDSSLIRIAPGT